MACDERARKIILANEKMNRAYRDGQNLGRRASDTKAPVNGELLRFI